MNYKLLLFVVTIIYSYLLWIFLRAINMYITVEFKFILLSVLFLDFSYDFELYSCNNYDKNLRRRNLSRCLLLFKK